MRKFVSFVVLASASCLAIASGPEVAKGFKRHDVGAGVRIDLPRKWAFQNYPMPLAGATNIRVTSGGLRMAITGFPLPEEAEAATQDNTAETLRMAMTPYVSFSKEGKVEPVAIANGRVHGAYGTLSSATSEPAFSIFAGRAYSCVTTAIVRTPGAAFSISVGSDACDGKEHQAAVLALAGMQEGG